MNMGVGVMAGDESLHGYRVLVVEDEFVVALLVEDVLHSLGCAMIGPASHIAAAMTLAQKEALDFALLDVNVAGERIFPVAEILCERGIPFAFVTGYGRQGLDDRFSEVPVLQKPFLDSDLVSLLKGQGRAR